MTSFDPLGSEKDELDISENDITTDVADEIFDVDSDDENKNDIGGNKDMNPLDNKSKNSYLSMFTDDFDMAYEMQFVPNLDQKVTGIISRAKKAKKHFKEEISYSDSFENICMDQIERIVGMNRAWTRQDAIIQAAKEAVTVEYTKQSREAICVHIRVLYEFIICSDGEYNLLRSQIWKQ